MRTLGLLPNARLALVEEQKVVDYLLASRHPAGRAKAAIFQRFGFDVEKWTMLRDALVHHARTAKMMSVTENEFGQKYVLEGGLPAPDGRSLRLRSVWFVNTGEIVPRLVTAYPTPGAGK